jgi:branched-chain amino acid aminotransferase
VLWLDGIERKYVEEIGTSNAFFVIDGVIITSPLTGTILPGVTRRTVIELLREKGFQVDERKLSIDELTKAAKSGRLEEAFATGTAAVIAPVGNFHYKGVDYIVNNNKIGFSRLRGVAQPVRQARAVSRDPLRRPRQLRVSAG